MMSKREKDWRKIDSRLIGLGREIGKYFKEMFIIDEEKLRKELEYENKFHRGRQRSMPESVVWIAVATDGRVTEGNSG